MTLLRLLLNEHLYVLIRVDSLMWLLVVDTLICWCLEKKRNKKKNKNKIKKKKKKKTRRHKLLTDDIE